MNSITFEREPDIAEWLTELTRITGETPSDLINLILDPWLRQAIANGDTGLLQSVLQSFEFETKEEALVMLDGYNRFVEKLKAHEGRMIHHDVCWPLYQASARAFAGADLLASPLPSKSASSLRAREAGTRAFIMRFSRPGTILERFLSRPLRPSDTHCSTLIGFIGMVFGLRPNLSSTAVFVTPAASTVT
jgi:hypothetical protein